MRWVTREPSQETFDENSFLEAVVPSVVVMCVARQNVKGEPEIIAGCICTRQNWATDIYCR